MAEFSIVGTRFGRVDGQDKATGRAKYIQDLKFPGMLHGKILRSPYPHARILNIETSRVEKLIGVRAVATAADTPNKKFGSYRSGVKDELIFAKDKTVSRCKDDPSPIGQALRSLKQATLLTSDLYVRITTKQPLADLPGRLFPCGPECRPHPPAD